MSSPTLPVAIPIEIDPESVSFTTIIQCSRSINGVFTLEIKDFEKIQESGMYDGADMFEECIFLHYRFIPIKADSDQCIDGKWHSKVIVVGQSFGQMVIRVPVFLTDYTIECFIKIKNPIQNQWMEPSNTVTVNIPSFLLSSQWNVGDRVVFQPKSEYYTLNGQITKILENDRFRVSVPLEFLDEVVQYDDPSLVISVQNDIVESVEIETCKSRMYREEPELQWTVDIAPKRDMIRLVLLETNNPQCLSVYDALYDHCILESICISREMFEEMEAVIHYEAMAQFIAKNVCDFLFQRQFHYKLDCLLAAHLHGSLRCWNVHQFHLKAVYEIRRQKLGNVPDVAAEMFAGYSCDICRIGLHFWDYMFECDNGYMDSHDFCLNCATNVIKMNCELKELLAGLLRDVLIVECIDTIADYVVGRTNQIVRAGTKRDNECREPIKLSKRQRIK